MGHRDLVETLRREPRSHDVHELYRRWSRSAVRSAVRAGHVTTVLPGLYSATEHAESFAVRAHASTTWAHPAAALVGAAAIAQWGLTDPPEVVTVAVPWGTQRECPRWLRLRRIEHVPPSIVVNDIRTVDLSWALATGYAEMDARSREAPVYLAVQQGLVDATELAAPPTLLARMRHRRDFLRLVAAVRAGSESHLETVGLRDVFTGGDFATFVRQHRLRVDGQAFRLDMYDPVTRTAVELDGAAHAEPVHRARDIARDAVLLAHGIATVRFSYRDLTARASWCRSIVRRVLAARRDPQLHAGRSAA